MPQQGRKADTLVVSPVRPVLTARQVAAILQVSPRTVERLIRRQELRAIHVGRRLRIPAEALQAYVNQADAASAEARRDTGAQDTLAQGTSP